MEKSYGELLCKVISADIMVKCMQPGFPCKYIGNKTVSLFGYDSEEEFRAAIDGKTENFIHIEDAEFAVNRIRQQLADFGEYAIEYRVRKKDGSYMWVQDRGKRVDNP
ncbi:MAG: PAS domain-containing protein, partial [Oscillospiraceae bacterium]